MQNLFQCDESDHATGGNLPRTQNEPQRNGDGREAQKIRDSFNKRRFKRFRRGKTRRKCVSLVRAE